MLDGKILDRARRLIKAEFAERQRVLPKEIARIKEEIVTTVGTAQCGATPKLVHATCAREVDIRAKIVWDSIQRAHNAVGSPITETLATDLKEEISHHIEKMVEEVSDFLTHELCLLKPPSCYLNLESTKREVNERIDVEVDSMLIQ